ncbi:MAG: transporter substrate-binding domain-containing protein [Burkholderiaceae bacterium]|nr:transporter substrate-binding domain-containing protein [Roseateles sp.]MBV8471461.1 transporter substrate-binding domain-containing protein [Burkholderiaceae bacterium]
MACLSLAKKYACSSLLALVAASSAAASPRGGATLSVCFEPEPAPWTFWVKDAQGNRTDKVAGFSVDFVRAALKEAGHEVKFVSNLPWARCVRAVERGEIDFAMEAYYDEARAQKFVFSTPYNTLTPQIFFRKDRPVQVNSAADLKRYKGCGLRGSSYAHYGLSSSDLTLVSDESALFYNVKAGICDYFPEELEEFQSFKNVGQDFMADPMLAHAAAPFAKAPSSHLMARRSEASEALLRPINRAIEHLVKSGDAAQIWGRYSKDMPYQP